MIVGKVVGSVWATRKEERLKGMKLLIVQHYNVDMTPIEDYHICVDLVDAGLGDLVLVTRGSSARQTTQTDKKPVDAIIVGVIDRIDLKK
ncbi:EutN/CcmL family microcompartment protein [candidate division WOR-3 bacterium]|nr:EutN/CcmL family microcompartment protein [candidate division WOR-3 bacterium]